MSTLSTLLPLSGTSNFVATGNLPNGRPVVLNTDGTVEIVNTTLAQSIPAGAVATFSANGQTNENIVVFDPHNANKFVIAYKDYGTSGGRGQAIVGTITGTTLTFGTPVEFGSKASYIDIAFDPNTAGKFVVIYADTWSVNLPLSIVGTISGTSITFGTEVAFSTVNGWDQNIVFDPSTAGKFVIVYKDAGNSEYGTVKIGTVSGTSITYGAATVFKSGVIYPKSIAFDPNTAGKFVISYIDTGNSSYGTAVVGTLSGTSFSFGTEVVYNSTSTGYGRMAFDPNTAGKLVVVYSNSSNTVLAIVGAVSGTSISFGSPVECRAQSSEVEAAYNPNNTNEFIVITRGNTGTELIVGTVSGTSITFANSISLGTLQREVYVAFDPNTAGQFINTYRDSSNSNYGKAVVGRIEILGGDPTNLTSTNFLGTSTSTYADGETASILLQVGISTNQTGLTAGSTYYVQPDGTLATTAGTPSVEAGKALSATSLFLSDTPVAAGGGAWEVISSQTVASTGIGSIEFTGIDATYSTHVVVFDVGTATDIQWHIRYGSTAGYPTTATDYYVVWNRAGSSSGSGQYATTGQGILTALSNSEASGTCTIHGLGASGTLRHYGSSYTKRVNNQNWIDATGGAYLNSTNVALSKLYIFPWGNLDIAVGSTVTLYGIKTS
jgi:hypothetical protein